MNDTDLMRKVAALLAKAEGTDNEHEAEAFYGKAMELMMRHSLDETKVRAAMSARTAKERPIKREYMYTPNNTYARSKERLLGSAARAGGVKVLFYPGSTAPWTFRMNGAPKYSRWCVFVGFERDVDRTEMLYTSLLIQHARFARADWKATGRKGENYSWVVSHMAGFARRVYERYVELENRVADATGSALIAVRENDVVEAVAEFFPNAAPGRAKRNKNDWDGYLAGMAAADRADLGQNGVAASATRSIAAGGRN